MVCFAHTGKLHDLSMRRSRGTTTLLPEVLLLGYRNGFFPMAEPESGQIQWHRPDPRGIIPLDAVRISRSLRQCLRRGDFTVTFNTEFECVMRHCAQRDDTWISQEIIDAYTELHHLGFAHSVETWKSGDLVGGLYGVAIQGAFFGESMFSLQSNASKVSFVYLIQRLLERGFSLLDTQYVNEFTESLGAKEIPDAEYQQMLVDALSRDSRFD